MATGNTDRGGMDGDVADDGIRRVLSRRTRAGHQLASPGGLRRLANDLSGRSDHRMVSLIAKQVETAVEGARLAESMAAGKISAYEARGLMSVLEHRGDDQRAELVLALAHSLTAPIDREDLFRLSRSVDDVLDDLRDFVRESDLYAMDDQEGVAPLLASIADGLQEMGVAVQNVVASSRTVTSDALLVKKHCNRVRQLYQLQLAGLFTGEVTVDMFKRRELLRRIDVVGLRMGEAADALLDGVLKRRH